MPKTIQLLTLALCLAANAANAGAPTIKYAEVDGARIFYREAGDTTKPTIVLLHGFPASSYMFKDLIPKLAGHFHVIAPDYPGMGFSTAPTSENFVASFDSISTLMEKFVSQLGEKHMLLYEQDFGGPVGMRLAVRHPEWVSGLILQNTPISLDGWDVDRLAAIKNSAELPIAAKRAAAAARVVPATAQFLYQQGTRRPQELDPAAWAVDAYVMSKPDSRRTMTELQMDIPSNFSLYPVWQDYLEKYQPKTLVVWGLEDPIFSMTGAEAVKRFVPDADIHYYDTGHFALEEYADEIADQIVRTFADTAVN